MVSPDMNATGNIEVRDDIAGSAIFDSSRPETARDGRKKPAFFINGRFVTQSVTGVQRYAYEVLRELDLLLSGGPIGADLIVPRTSSVSRPSRHMGAGAPTTFAGHLWEQVALPFLCNGPILNLCNLAPLASTRNVVCIHDANVFASSESYNRSFGLAYRFLLPRIARRAARITTVSRKASQDLSRYLGISAKRIEIIPNGHEHALRWRPEQSAFRGRTGGWRRYVLLVGSLAPHKNIGRILKLAEALDGLGLDIVVIGTSSGPFSSMTETTAHNIRFLGRVSDDDLAFLLDYALCLAFPSRQEGFGIPVVEAMARGCPVVASDASCLPEICGGAALLADPALETDWYTHIESLSRSASLRDDLKGRGLENIRRFSWRASAEAYAELMIDLSR